MKRMIVIAALAAMMAGVGTTAAEANAGKKALNIMEKKATGEIGSGHACDTDKAQFCPEAGSGVMNCLAHHMPQLQPACQKTVKKRMG